VAGSCEHGDEPSVSGATELISKTCNLQVNICLMHVLSRVV
jgi:hypothetical protein